VGHETTDSEYDHTGRMRDLFDGPKAMIDPCSSVCVNIVPSWYNAPYTVVRTAPKTASVA